MVKQNLQSISSYLNTLGIEIEDIDAFRCFNCPLKIKNYISKDHYFKPFLKKDFNFYSETSIKSYNLDEKIRYQLSMLDSLDVFTRKHCENVAALTCRICEYLHCNKGFTEYCTICAYLHDIGKLFIPPEILQKPAKLTESEYEIIKTLTFEQYNKMDHFLFLLL